MAPCRRCHLEHAPVTVVAALWALRDFKPKPPPAQLAALFLLYSRLDPRTGCGWTANVTLAADAGVSEDVVERATRWARDRFLVHRARKGGRDGSGHVNQTLWFLLPPPQTRSSAGMTAASNPRQRGDDSRDPAVSNPRQDPSQTRAGAGLSKTREVRPEKNGEPDGSPPAAPTERNHAMNRNVPPPGDTLPGMEPPAAPPAKAPTEAQRSNRLADAYYEAVSGMCNHQAVALIARKAIQAGHGDDATRAALLRLAADDRPVTADTLRIELNGHSRRPRESGVTMAMRLLAQRQGRAAGEA